MGVRAGQAKAKAKEEGFELGKSTGSFRANSKALAELEGTGIAKVQSPRRAPRAMLGRRARPAV